MNTRLHFTLKQQIIIPGLVVGAGMWRYEKKALQIANGNAATPNPLQLFQTKSSEQE